MRLSALAFAAAALAPARLLAGEEVVGGYSHANDFFGGALALDGDRIAVGAAGSNANGFDAGIVHVYTFDDGGWQLEAQLHNPADEAARGYFGTSLALAGDTLAVGATLDDGYSLHHDERRGAVHVFARAGDGWRLQASLDDPETDHDGFGSIVALAGDILAVASDSRVRAREPLPPRVRLFHRHGDAWDELADLSSPGEFIRAIGLGDGTLLVSADGGPVAYRRDGDVWAEDPSWVAEGGRHLLADADTALVAGYGSPPRATLYRDRDGGWSLEAELAYAGAVDSASLGAVALRDDAAAFYYEFYDEASHERVSLWRRREGAWQHVGDLDPPSDLPGTYAEFGATLAVNSRWLAVAAPRAGEPEAEQSGLVVVYDGELREVARLSPEDEPAGCGCRTHGDRAGLLIALLALGRRRRRR